MIDTSGNLLARKKIPQIKQYEPIKGEVAIKIYSL